MQKYIFAYHGGRNFETKEEGATHRADWEKWVTDLGDAVIDPGMPVGKSKTVSAEGIADNGGPNPLSGISILQADSIEAALEMAKNCPFTGIGGTIEVAPIMQM